MAVTMLSTATVILGLLFAFGLVLVFVGVRGRRSSEHPFCRKCRFDLFGNPTADSCPECGAKLKLRGAVREGRRKRNARAIGWGAALVFLAVLAGGPLEFNRRNGPGLNPHKPMWLLLREMQSPYKPQGVAASEELLDRYNGKTLSERELQDVLNAALDLQGNREAHWLEEWGDVIEDERTFNVLSDRQWQRYLNQICDLTFEVRPTVRSGQPIPCRLISTNWRMGSNSRPRIGTVVGAMIGAGEERVAVPVGDVLVQLMCVRASTRGTRWDTATFVVNEPSIVDTVFGSAESGQRLSASPGEQMLRVTIEWRDLQVPGPMSPFGRDPDLYLKSTSTFDSPVHITAADEPTVRLVSIPNVRQRVLALPDPPKALVVFNERKERVFITHPPTEILTIAGELPVFMDVELQQGERDEWRYTLQVDSIDDNYVKSEFQPVARSSKRLDRDLPIRMRIAPNIERAEQTVDVFEIWGDEIVFEDVEILWREADSMSENRRGDLFPSPVYEFEESRSTPGAGAIRDRINQ